MTQDSWQDTWAGRVTGHAIEEIKRLREAKEPKWSAQRLADECKKLGLDISRATISDLENHRRANFGIPELLVMARALDIPPLLLIFPVGSKEETEVLPGESRPTFRAALWFTGEAASPARATDDGEVIVEPDRTGEGRPLALYRTHDEEFRKEIGSVNEAAKMGEMAAALPDSQRESAASVTAMLHEAAAAHRRNGELIREQAAAEGLIPPARIVGLIADDTKGAAR